ncbi:MAG TPA: hypothetical protein VKZ67_00530 [Natronosporangium sp.]|nr:hypothetical protein [Natronosporangium sp.]
MTFPSDDLTPLLTRRGGGGGVSYASGVIRSWNPTTFANVVEVRGTVFRNLPVLASTDALTYTTGDVVGLISYDPTGSRGATTWAIAGRWVIPGSGSAERIIQFLQTSLARRLVDELVQELLISESGQELAAFVLASRIKSATAAPSVLTSSSTYVALSGGPEVTDVPVSESGKMLVMVGCEGVVSSAIGQPDQAAAMSFAISGATTRPASDDEAYIVAYVDIDEVSFFHGRSMAVAEITGLNPGLHTVSARYRKVFGGGAVDFSLRTLIAIGL